MTEIPYILFCESPLDASTVDPDYEDECINAKKNGFNILLFNFDALTDEGSFETSTKRIKTATVAQTVIYRGWMLTPKQYASLYSQLKNKNYILVNSPKEYQNCHYLPDSLKFIEAKTPKTIFQKFEGLHSIDQLIDKAKIFGAHPVILKDYVKSEKHNWEIACYVNDASDNENLRQSILNLIQLRGKYLNEGIVIRAFVELNHLTIHSKSGMPLTEEYRLFFYNKKLFAVYNYWEEGIYDNKKLQTAAFENIASGIDSNFFSMDIAIQKNGQLLIIELGDGQVAGLPDKVNRNDFYTSLMGVL